MRTGKTCGGCRYFDGIIAGACRVLFVKPRTQKAKDRFARRLATMYDQAEHVNASAGVEILHAIKHAVRISEKYDTLVGERLPRVEDDRACSEFRVRKRNKQKDTL